MDYRLIDISEADSEAIGQLMDILHSHLNEYELKEDELKALNQAEDVLSRIWYLHNLP